MHTNTRWLIAGALISTVAACSPPTSFVDSGSDARADVTGSETGTDVVTTMDAGTDAHPDSGTDVSTMDVTATDSGTDVTGSDTTIVDVVPVDVVDVVPVDAGGDASTSDAMPSGLCDGAINLNTAGTVSGSTTSYSGSNASAPMMAALLPTDCTTETGRQIVHTYTTTARGALRISTVDSATSFDTVALAVDGCSTTAAALGCNDDSASTKTGESEFTTGILPAGTTVVILVGGYDSTAPDTGSYALHVTQIAEVAVGGTCDPTQAMNRCVAGSSCTTGTAGSTCTLLPYVESTTAAMCDDLSLTGVADPDATGDDSTSQTPLALPSAFAFTYFGTAVDHYSVATNGYLQLWTGATGTPSAVYANDPIPTSALTNFVAPLWDDLDVNAPASVRTATFGTAPTRRFVTEWNNAAFHGDSMSVLRFQAKLFETTNVIEFHYCTLTPSDDTRASGDSATVGIENTAGDVGVQHSNDTAASISTATAIRFTPR